MEPRVSRFGETVTRVLRAALASGGMTSEEVEQAVSIHAPVAITFTASQIMAYTKKRFSTEDSHDQAFADLSAWADKLI